MRGNWQHPNWPKFRFRPVLVAEREALFLRQSGVVIGTIRHVPDDERLSLIIELISTEALKTSEIEGELLDHESVRSSPLGQDHA
jgi:Fic family protein